MLYAQTRIRQEDETHKIPKDFQIQRDHLIPTRPSDEKQKQKQTKKMKKKKEGHPCSGLCCLSRPQSENKKRKEK